IAHNTARKDKNTVLQFDLVGQKLNTGTISHTFQAGVDYRYNDLFQPTYNSIKVDTINVLDPSTVTNKLPSDFKANFERTGGTQAYDQRFGVTLQDVMQLNKWARVYGGIRFSTTKTRDDGVNSDVSSFWNPLAGV